MIKLYNTFSKKIETFVPLEKNKVSIYVCGITPYDTTHLGHAFVYVTFDALIKYFMYKGYAVNYTQNVTDIDDDILQKAKEENKDWKDLGKYWTAKFLNDLNYLNVLFPKHYVKATDSMGKIIKIIVDLKSKGIAYQKEGNVYFDVTKFKNYGKLSRYTKQQMVLISKERGADPTDPLKKNPLDFILWQKTKAGEPFWESPWGNGRPGWHIECSAMINTYLGDQIDIHGGGRDLIYPHHESEIAQSESFTGKKPFVKYWMHISMLLYEGEKMSKSLGNLIMVSDLSKKYDANAIRWLLLSHHYRNPWEFDYSEIDDATKKINSIKKACNKTKLIKIESRKNYIEQFEDFMEDDLNTPKALELVMEISNKINSENLSLQKDLVKILDVLGFKLN